MHVMKDGNEAKYNVEPTVVQVFNHGFKKHEISMIESIIEENVNVIKERWQFGSRNFGQPSDSVRGVNYISLSRSGSRRPVE